MFEQLWNDLSTELNVIGPPKHSAKEWRKVWSNHKYQNKKRRISVGSAESMSFVKFFIFSETFYVVIDEAKEQDSVAIVAKNKTLKDTFGNFQQQVLEKFDFLDQTQKLLLQQQNGIIASQNQIVETQKILLDKVNLLLEKS